MQTIHRRFNYDLSAAQPCLRPMTAAPAPVTTLSAGEGVQANQTFPYPANNDVGHVWNVFAWRQKCQKCQHQPQLEKPSSQTAFGFPARPSSLDNNDPALCQPRRIHDNIYHFLLSSSYLFPSGSSKLLTLAPVLTVCAALTDWIWGTGID